MLTSVRPTSAQSFLVAARALFSGAEALAVLTTPHPMACAFLAAQSLECALKAYLAHDGKSEITLSRRPYGHDLERLWLEASRTGLPIQSTPPEWCTTLTSGHSYPYRFRYPLKLNGYTMPALAPMAAELKVVIQSIEQFVK